MRRVLAALLVAVVASPSNSAEAAGELEPAARVSIDPGSRVPDHVSQIAGAPPSVMIYDGALDAGHVYRISANPQAGFLWPYFLSVPVTIAPGASVLMEPNNDGLWGAPFETHEYWASIRNEQLHGDFGRPLSVPTLTPVFPRPLLNGEEGNLYIHALTRAAMTHEDRRYARPDLQILAMLDDARDKLAAEGYVISPAALLWGFSAAADFVTRIAVLHPERVRAVAAGGLGGLPILPLERYAGERLTYPVGVGDLEEVARLSLKAAALRATPMLLFQGSADENDSIEEPPFACDEFASDSYSCAQAMWVNETFGSSTVDRVSAVSAIYRYFGMADFNSIILPGIGHRVPEAMTASIREFYACVLGGRSGCAARVSVPDLSRAMVEQAAKGK